MAISASQLLGLVEIRGATESIAKLEGVGRATDSAGAKLAGLAVGGTVLAAAGLVALGAAAVKMDADLQQGINRLRTGGGDIQDTFKSLRSGIQSVAVATGELTGPLIPAMYLIVGAGQRGAQAMDTLKVASEGAQIEQANVADVANVVSGVMTNYGTKLYNATQYMNGLIYAVAHGKITLQDLATAMGPIDPIAQQLGIHMQDVAAAMTTQTNAMIPATRAATGLRFMMQGLENPTKKARDEMAAMGLDSIKVAEEMKVSLPLALEMIYDAAKKAGPEGSVPFNRSISDMIGGVRGFTAFTALTGPHMQDFIDNTKNIGTAMAASTTQVKGWDIAQSNLNIQWDRGKAALEVLGQNVGEVLMPYVEQLLANVTPLIARFDDWFVKSGRLATVIKDIGTGLSTLVSVAGTTAGIIGNIAHAFTDAGAEGDILRSALIALGAAFAEIKIFQFAQGVAGTIMFLKDLIPALGSATVAFGGLDIAMAPLALVIGAIALAAAGAAYAFTHWSDIIKQNDQQVGQYLKDYQADGNGINAQTETIGGFFSRLGSGVKTTFESMHIGTLGSLNAMVSDTNNRTAQMAADAKKNADQMQTNVTTAMATMASNSLDAIRGIKQKGGQSFDDLLAQVNLDMSTMDVNAKGYWDDVMNYIEGHTINGHIVVSMAGGIGIQTSATTQAHASGTSYAPGGWSWVGERGPELMNVPQGAQIIPHDQSVARSSGGIGASGPITLHLTLQTNGQTYARAIIPDLVAAIRQATGVKI